MEIWISEGEFKTLRKELPFLRDYGVLDIKDILEYLKYESSFGLNDHSSFILNSEIKKRLIALNSSKRFYRILLLVEDCREELAYSLLRYSIENDLKYEAFYVKTGEDFHLVCKSY